MKKMKYGLLVMFLFSVFVVNGQDKVKLWDENRAKVVRLSRDSFYGRGDTLYLMFDASDTLQVKRGTRIEWWLRPLTKEEEDAVWKDQNTDMYLDLMIEFSPHPRYRKRIVLSPGEVKAKAIATREEFMAFYERESRRCDEEYKRTKDRRVPIALGEWPLDYYFKKIFMIELLEDGNYVMYEV